MARKKLDLTQGSIMKGLIALALPIIGANLLQTGYQLVDAFWVGRLGSNAVAAVSISYPVNFLLISLSSGFAFAGSILVAQYAGAKQPKMVNHVAAQTLTMVVLVSIALSAIAYQLSPNILYALGVEDEIFEDANFFQKMILILKELMILFLVWKSHTYTFFHIQKEKIQNLFILLKKILKKLNQREVRS